MELCEIKNELPPPIAKELQYLIKLLVTTNYDISQIRHTKCQKHFSLRRKHFFSRSKNQWYCSLWIWSTKFTYFAQKSNQECQPENYLFQLCKTYIQNIEFFCNILLPLLHFYSIIGFTTWLPVQLLNHMFFFYFILNNFLTPFLSSGWDSASKWLMSCLA